MKANEILIQAVLSVHPFKRSDIENYSPEKLMRYADPNNREFYCDMLGIDYTTYRQKYQTFAQEGRERSGKTRKEIN